MWKGFAQRSLHRLGYRLERLDRCGRCAKGLAEAPQGAALTISCTMTRFGPRSSGDFTCVKMSGNHRQDWPQLVDRSCALSTRVDKGMDVAPFNDNTFEHCEADG